MLYRLSCVSQRREGATKHRYSAPLPACLAVRLQWKAPFLTCCPGLSLSPTFRRHFLLSSRRSSTNSRFFLPLYLLSDDGEELLWGAARPLLVHSLFGRAGELTR
ncbi:hypothetical protein MRX96_023736 [Rhipicephalus microplus]